MNQTTKHILLVQPANFGYNNQTANSNAFQNQSQQSVQEIQKQALKEFNRFAETLINNKIDVTIVEDSLSPIKPDAIFPNNWISLHENGTVVLYPMYAPNRRLEVSKGVIDGLKEYHKITQVIDLRHYEAENKFLEGTGSVVFNHQYKIAYACFSERTHQEPLQELCKHLGYTPVSFNAVDENGKAIYHTNVLMCIGQQFVTICIDAIAEKDKQTLLNSFTKTGLEVIDISFNQLNHFAGNMIELKDNEGNSVLILSQSAYNSLDALQKQRLNRYSKLLPINIDTIETIAGGSARCMIAEIFNPQLSE